MSRTGLGVVKQAFDVSRYARLLSRTVVSLQTDGVWNTGSRIARRVRRKLGRFVPQVDAADPIQNAPGLFQIRLQRAWSREQGYRPRLQLVLPLSDHDPQRISKTIRTLRGQTYTNWSLLIIASPPADSHSESDWKKLIRSDARVRIAFTKPGETPFESLHLALESPAEGYLGLIREGDALTVEALYQVASAIARRPEADVVYTDEAHWDPAQKKRRHLLLKPGWSPDMLLSYNYLGGLCVFRRELFDNVGGFQRNFGQAQEWDLALRFFESKAHFERVPICCYLRRTDRGFRPAGLANADTAGDYRGALEAHIHRQQKPARAEVMENGTLRLRWKIAEEPKVSIIIPNKNSLNLITPLVEGLRNKTDYTNKEIIIVDNQSTDPDLQRFYEQRVAAGDVKVVPFNRRFNYSAACNAGARAATGDLLLFLNNDMEVVSADWLHEMVGLALEPGVGVVGAKLRYPNGALQHCGIVMGLHYITHIWHQAQDCDWGVFGTPDSYRNHLAVTGACQMVKRSLFEDLGGYDENYEITCSDILFCLAARNQGKRIVSTPHAELIHYESLTRGDAHPLPDVSRMTKALRELRITEDPYFHPNLNAEEFLPTLRKVDEVLPSDMLRSQLDKHDPPADVFIPVDLFDPKVVRDVTEDWGFSLAPPCYDPADVGENIDDAAAFILHVLLGRRDLRDEFPRALSEGAQGSFCRWLCNAGLEEYRLPKSSAGKIREAFQSRPGVLIRKIFSFSPELREEHPMAFLPAGQRRFLKWVLETRNSHPEMRDEDIWWLFLEAAEDPVRELEFTYRVSSELQKNFPIGLTVFGCERFLDWLKARHRFDDELIAVIRERYRSISADDFRYAYKQNTDWQFRYPQAFRDVYQTEALLDEVQRETGGCAEAGLFDSSMSAPLSLNVLGHFCYPSGLQQSVRSLVRSMNDQGIEMALRDVPAHFSMDDPNRESFLDLERHDISLIHVQPQPDVETPYIKSTYHVTGLHPRRDVYRIGYWYWELEDVPATWEKASQSVQELWAPTTFIADAMRRHLDQTVTPMLPGVQVGAVESVKRGEFGINDDEFFFLFVFDMKSVMERKNPLGLIEAYRKAFRRDDRAKLLIKVSSGDFQPSDLKRLKQAAKDAGVLLLDEMLTRERSFGLIQACDCYVSLHRSEGLGLTLAEAMLLGRPVIGTRYSGNLDFMDDSCSMLVDYEMRQLKGNCPDFIYRIYPENASWADPSVEHAASLMRWAYENQDEARAMGLRGKLHAEDVLSPQAAGVRLRRRLEEIHNQIHHGKETPPLVKVA